MRSLRADEQDARLAEAEKESQGVTDPLEEAVKTRQLLVIACDEDGELVIEENSFPPWQAAGIAVWLGMMAEAALDSDEDEEDDEFP